VFKQSFALEIWYIMFIICKGWKKINTFESSINLKMGKVQYNIFKTYFVRKTTCKLKTILLTFLENLLNCILNIWFFKIIVINSKNMFILIIKIINIYKFKVSKVILWLLSTYVARIWHCLHYHAFTFKQAMDLWYCPYEVF
jgi:hypothetical protein